VENRKNFTVRSSSFFFSDAMGILPPYKSNVYTFIVWNSLRFAL